MTEFYAANYVPILAARPKPLSPKKPSVIAVLDIGSHKIACAIACMRPVDKSDVLPNRTHIAEVLGFGHQRSEGIKCGTVVDAKAAEQAIRNTIDHAERASGVEIGGVLINVSCGRLNGRLYTGSNRVTTGEVKFTDVQKLCNQAIYNTMLNGRMLLHCLPKSYKLDDVSDIQSPEGLFGKNLHVELHAASVDSAALNNLIRCVERCHLHVDGVIATPYASGLAVLADDEARLGSTVIDIGAGTTTIAIFEKGKLVHMDAIAIGGQHITNDIARGLSTRLTVAERLKTLHGSVISTTLDEREFLTISPIGAADTESTQHIPRSKLVSIIRPRVEEIFELVLEKLKLAPHTISYNRNIVITGGTAQLPGLIDFAKSIFNRSVRIGRPLGVSGMPDAAKGAAFSALAGMMIAPQLVRNEVTITDHRHSLASNSGGYFSKVGHWLKESF